MLNKIASKYPTFVSGLYNRLRLLLVPFKKIEKYVPNGTILDVGCGYGIFSMYLAISSNKRDVIGSDLNATRVKIAKKTSADLGINNIRFYAKDLMSNMGDLNGIVLIDVLHHISYKKQKILFEKAIKSLKKGGKIIIKDLETEKNFKYYWNYMHDKIMTLFEKQYFASSNDVKKYFEKKGFKVKKKNISNLFYSHYLLICEKE